jgi:hypothetical protein
VWGSFLGHQVFSFDGVAEFVHSLVYGSSRFTDVHEEVLVDRSDAVEAGGLCSVRPDAGLIVNPKINQKSSGMKKRPV